MNKLIQLSNFIDKQIPGDWGKNHQESNFTQEVFCIRGADIDNVNLGNYDDLPIRFLKNGSERKFLTKGHIIIEVSGGSPTQSTGRIAYIGDVNKKLVCSNFCRAYKIKPIHNPKYFYYLIKYLYNSRVFYNFESKTTGIKNLLVDVAFQSIKIPEIDKYTQTKIADTLLLLDSKIELNNKINTKLEHLAKMIYDYWFVQFDFPDVNGKPYKSSRGKMVWNKELKREIPEEWKVGTLLDIAEYTNGLPCQKYRPNKGEDSLRVIKIKEMHEGFSPETEFVRANIPQKLIIDNGDILFSWSASLEVQIWSKGKGALNQHIFKVTSNKYPKSFYYFQLFNYLHHFKMMAETRKTTMGHITQEHLQQSRIVLPPKELTLILENIISPLFLKKIDNEIENYKLNELRDWLLPMLMNGQVKIN